MTGRCPDYSWRICFVGLGWGRSPCVATKQNALKSSVETTTLSLTHDPRSRNLGRAPLGSLWSGWLKGLPSAWSSAGLGVSMVPLSLQGCLTSSKAAGLQELAFPNISGRRCGSLKAQSRKFTMIGLPLLWLKISHRASPD